MDHAAIAAHVDRAWDESIVPTLVDYIRIPNKSPLFDPRWAEHGHMAEAVSLLAGWARANAPAGSTVEVVELEGRTPVILVDVPGEGEDTVLLYGHLDKQPEMTGWAPGLGPFEPVIREGRLYGRGGADDGYSIFASLEAIRALEAQGAPHARCVVLIEACEESGSYDLPAYVEHLGPRLGNPSLVVCLDSGCGDYERLWLTTSLRGLTGGTLTVEVLEEGVHSGDASGIVPSSFRIARMLLSRLEDEATGRIVPDGFHVVVPSDRVAQAEAAAAVLGEAVFSKFPRVPGLRPMQESGAELVLARTWRPALSITGADGLPPLESAGNVLRPRTALKLSLRLPPTLDGVRAGEHLKQLLETDPPHGARVRFELEKASRGWNAPALAPWLERSLQAASTAFFGEAPALLGEGGSIPFMGMLGERFPEAQFVITGVLGPHSNAHGPNEFLDLPTGKRVTSCIARLLADHRARDVAKEA